MTFGLRLFSRSAHSRAERHLHSVQIEFDAAKKGHEDSSWVASALAFLTEGTAALQNRQVEHCWHFINAARRQLASAQSDTERSLSARVLLIEADKLSSWRRKGIESVLRDASAPSAAALREALWLRDDYYENRYHRIDMQREHLRTVVVIGALALAATIAVSATAPVRIDDLLPNTPWHWRVLVVALAFGVLGASFSAAKTVTVKDLGTVIPELALSKWIIWARTLFGASLGLAGYMFLQSGLLSFGVTNLATAASIAFAGGFSEHVVLKVISNFGERELRPPK
jgi:hypothetical protein